MGGYGSGGVPLIRREDVWEVGAADLKGRGLTTPGASDVIVLKQPYGDPVTLPVRCLKTSIEITFDGKPIKVRYTHRERLKGHQVFFICGCGEDVPRLFHVEGELVCRLCGRIKTPPKAYLASQGKYERIKERALRSFDIIDGEFVKKAGIRTLRFNKAVAAYQGAQEVIDSEQRERDRIREAQERVEAEAKAKADSLEKYHIKMEKEKEEYDKLMAEMEHERKWPVRYHMIDNTRKPRGRPRKKHNVLGLGPSKKRRVTRF